MAGPNQASSFIFVSGPLSILPSGPLGRSPIGAPRVPDQFAVNCYVFKHISLHKRWEMSIKVDLKEFECENVEWIYVDKGRDQRPAVDALFYELGDPYLLVKGCAP
jgi:hypothetical protein